LLTSLTLRRRVIIFIIIMYAMAKADDDKKAFDDMMAEISSSGSDDDELGSGPGLTQSVQLRDPINRSRSSSSGGGSSVIRAIGPSTSASIAKSSASVSYASESKPYSSQSLQQQKKQQSSSSSQLSHHPVPSSFKLSKQEQEIESFGQDHNASSYSYGDERADQLQVTKRWLARPCGVDDRQLMQCYVERERSTFYGTTYRCYLENAAAMGGGLGLGSSYGKEVKSGTGGRFLMSAKKKVSDDDRDDGTDGGGGGNDDDDDEYDGDDNDDDDDDWVMRMMMMMMMSMMVMSMIMVEMVIILTMVMVMGMIMVDRLLFTSLLGSLYLRAWMDVGGEQEQLPSSFSGHSTHG
jgi:hypothetical protein